MDNLKMHLRLLLWSAFLLLSANGAKYNEKYRLQVHFSVPRGWGNDPNGLIYAGGYYHMYYQHNPVNTTAGWIHWGHTRSKDLIHWENMPIALTPQGSSQIFSGCCVLANRSFTGVGTDEDAENKSDILYAIYTLHNNEAKIHETQVMSYSFDDGKTFAQYKNNPIIKNPGTAETEDFRDPNIFKRNNVYYMALAVHDHISFYSSDNLVNWKFLSSFGEDVIVAERSGVWECPSLFALKDEDGKEHDILIVSSNGDEKGSLTQYFVGKFDGTRFNSYAQSTVLWIENGFDNYAAIPYHNDPRGRVVLIGWMSNWLYGNNIPTNIWRGQYTIPRELSLQTVDGKLHVAQRPVNELDKIVDPPRKWSLSKSLELKGKQTVDLARQIPFKTKSMLKMEYTLDIECAKKGNVSLRFGNNVGEFVSFNYDVSKRTYEFDRRRSGNIAFSNRFADHVASADRISTSNLLTGQVVLDVASIEIFADSGLNTFTSIFFPTKPYENIQIISNIENTSKCVKIKELKVEALRSIH